MMHGFIIRYSLKYWDLPLEDSIEVLKLNWLEYVELPTLWKGKSIPSALECVLTDELQATD